MSERACRQAGKAIEKAATIAPAAPQPALQNAALPVGLDRDFRKRASLSARRPRVQYGAGGSDECRLGEARAGADRSGCASGAEQRLLAAATVTTGGCDGGGNEACQNRAWEPEEEEHDAGIEAVRARLRERGPEVVADDAGALESCLEVAGATGCPRRGDDRVRRQGCAESSRGSVTRRGRMTRARRSNSECQRASGRTRTLSGGGAWRRAGRRRAMDWNSDARPAGRSRRRPERARREARARRGDRVAGADAEVRGQLLRDQGAVPGADQLGQLARETWHGSGAGMPRTTPGPALVLVPVAVAE